MTKGLATWIPFHLLGPSTQTLQGKTVIPVAVSVAALTEMFGSTIRPSPEFGGASNVMMYVSALCAGICAQYALRVTDANRKTPLASVLAVPNRIHVFSALAGCPRYSWSDASVTARPVADLARTVPV